MINELLLCVGAQKTGTTWLHSHLKDHPQIGFSNVKEVHYFNTMHNGSYLLARRKVNLIENIIQNNRSAVEKYFMELSCGQAVDKQIERLLSPVDDAWYTSLLSTEKKYAADFTPEYALLPNEGFEHIKAISKKQKMIFIMRDPIARSKSAIQYFYKTQSRDIQAESGDEIMKVAKNSFIVDMSKYEITIENLERNFLDTDILYLFYEDIMLNKQESIDKVTEFLSIDAISISDEMLDKKVNPSAKYDFDSDINAYLQKELAGTYEFMRSKYNQLPESWCSKSVVDLAA